MIIFTSFSCTSIVVNLLGQAVVNMQKILLWNTKYCRQMKDDEDLFLITISVMDVLCSKVVSLLEYQWKVSRVSLTEVSCLCSY